MFIEKQQQQIYGHTQKITYNSNIHQNHRQTLYCFFFLQKWNSIAYSKIFKSIEPLLCPGILLGTWNIQESNSDKTKQTKQRQQNCDFMVLIYICTIF